MPKMSLTRIERAVMNPHCVYVISSNGTFACDAKTGAVTEVQWWPDADPEYQKITHIGFPEGTTPGANVTSWPAVSFMGKATQSLNQSRSIC